MKRLTLTLILYPFIGFGQQNALDTLVPRQIRDVGQQNIGRRFPGFAEKSIEGASFTLDDLKGKVVFINFWWESCLPCIAEFPFMNGLYERYKNDNRFQFLSFTIASKETAAEVKRKYDINFPVICVDMKKCEELSFSRGFPVNIILDKGSALKLILVGGPRSHSTFEKIVTTAFLPKINELLNKTGEGGK